MYSTLRYHASPTPSCPKIRLLITIMDSGETAIQALGLTEREGDASHQLAERLRPELDALDAAVRNGGAK